MAVPWVAVVTVVVLAASPNVFGEWSLLSQSRSGVTGRPTGLLGRPDLHPLHGFFGPLYSRFCHQLREVLESDFVAIASLPCRPVLFSILCHLGLAYSIASSNSAAAFFDQGSLLVLHFIVADFKVATQTLPCPLGPQVLCSRRSHSVHSDYVSLRSYCQSLRMR